MFYVQCVANFSLSSDETESYERIMFTAPSVLALLFDTPLIWRCVEYIRSLPGMCLWLIYWSSYFWIFWTRTDIGFLLVVFECGLKRVTSPRQDDGTLSPFALDFFNSWGSPFDVCWERSAREAQRSLWRSHWLQEKNRINFRGWFSNNCYHHNYCSFYYYDGCYQGLTLVLVY